MNLREILVAFLLGLSYTGLWLLLVSFRVSFDIPTWWYPVLGENNASALKWIQLDHSFNLLLAALPISGAIVYLFRTRWRLATLITAVIPTLLITFDSVQGYFLVGRMEGVEKNAIYVLSSCLDIFKVGAILYLLVVTTSWLRPTNKQGLGTAGQPPQP
jgi:hypothetical protein